MINLLIDFSQIIYKTYFINIQKQPDDSFAFWRFLILKSILNLNKLFNPNEIVLCCDSKSWRKDIFPEYKAGRIKNNSVNKLFEEVDIFIDELQTRFPYKVIKIQKAEADDIIATLVFNKKPEDIIYICSDDHDFIQLLKYDKIGLYNLMSEEFVEFPIKNGKNEFKTVEDYTKDFLLRGCVGDGCPNILSDNDTFITEGKRQIVMNKKRIEKILNEGIENQLYYNRNRNVLLLEPNIIPKDIQSNIMNEYNNCKIVKSIDKIHDFFEHYNMQSLYGKEIEFQIKI
jgi:hypothetical protein